MISNFRHCCKCLFGCYGHPQVAGHPSTGHPIKVVVPEVKSLFDECEWRPFFSLSFPYANTWDIEMRAIALRKKKVYRHHACGEDINSAMYIDVRTREDDIPWDETDEYITKITPQ